MPLPGRFTLGKDSVRIVPVYEAGWVPGLAIYNNVIQYNIILYNIIRYNTPCTYIACLVFLSVLALHHRGVSQCGGFLYSCAQIEKIPFI
jgi:hypothetical protein